MNTQTSVNPYSNKFLRSNNPLSQPESKELSLYQTYVQENIHQPELIVKIAYRSIISSRYYSRNTEPLSGAEQYLNWIKKQLTWNTTGSLNRVQLEFAQGQNRCKEFDWIHNLNPYARLNHLRDLKNNWDGYHAPVFSEEHIQRAIDIYLRFFDYSSTIKNNYSDINPFVAPCSDGSILLEWGGKRFPIRQLEITIPNNSQNLLQYLKTSETLEEENEIKDDSIFILFDWLFHSK